MLSLAQERHSEAVGIMEVERKNSDLKWLIQLQELDHAIFELRKKVERLPQELEELDRVLQAHRSAYQESVQQVEELNKNRRRLEGEVEDLRQKLSRYKDQLMEVKTNKEYQALLHEIETVQGKISAREDEILEQLLQLDELDAARRAHEQQLSEEEKGIAARKKELEAFLAASDVELSRLKGERDRLQSEISQELLSQYERIAAARNGYAVAEARDSSCQACHVRLRPQLFAQLKTSQDIITCESCNRILYYPDAFR